MALVLKLILLAIPLVSLSRSALQPGAAQVPLSTPLELRNATASDAGDIAKIILAAFHDSPHFRYVWQFKDKYPQDAFDCFHQALEPALALPDVLAQIVLMPDINPPHNMKPIAVALWALPPTYATYGCHPYAPLLSASRFEGGSCQKVVNGTRAIDADEQFSFAKSKYLDAVYLPPNQLYLDSLATRPDYQRRGAGGALVRSGVDLGRKFHGEANVTATLVATEAGEPLYAHLQWDSMKNFTVKSLDEIDGEREKWRFDVMKYEL